MVQKQFIYFDILFAIGDVHAMSHTQKNYVKQSRFKSISFSSLPSGSKSFDNKSEWRERNT